MQGFSVQIQAKKYGNQKTSQFTKSPLVTVNTPEPYVVSFEWDEGALLFEVDDFLDLAEMVKITTARERRTHEERIAMSRKSNLRFRP